MAMSIMAWNVEPQFVVSDVATMSGHPAESAFDDPTPPWQEP